MDARKVNKNLTLNNVNNKIILMVIMQNHTRKMYSNATCNIRVSTKHQDKDVQFNLKRHDFENNKD